MKALDLFCGAGGATRGLQLAGFEVFGVDSKPQPRYCGDRFIQTDALALPAWFLRIFDLIWASPPCQAHTAMRTMHNALAHQDLIPATRAMLAASAVPFVIENVENAPLRDPVCLCGTMFRLGTASGAELRRHRIVEANFNIPRLDCAHGENPVIGLYGGHVRNRRRREGSASRGVADFSIAEAHEAMEIDWMTLQELSQAIPPAYSRFVAASFLSQRQTREAAE